MNEKLNIEFEWDEHKNQNNKIIHDGVSFNEASSVFDDENALIVDDFDHSFMEERLIIIGKSYLERVLFVCFCERHDNIVRIISARRADKLEREEYYANVR